METHHEYAFGSVQRNNSTVRKLLHRGQGDKVTRNDAITCNLFTRLVLHILHLIRAALRADIFDGVFDLNLACSLKYQRASYAIPFI